MADLWYYTSEGKQMEPVTNAELRQLAGTGFLRPTDMVWKEGMANWVKASAVTGLFPAAPAGGSRPSAAAGSSNRVTAAPSAPRPAAKPERRPRSEPEERDDDPDDDEERRPRRRRRPASRSGSGLIIGLVLGGVVVVLLILGLTLVLVFRGGPSGNFAQYSVDLGPMMWNTRDFEFKAATTYEFKVTSDRRTDVDLHIETLNGQTLMADTTIGPNSFLRWVPPAGGNYRVKVINLDIARQNKSHIGINEKGPGAPMAAPPPMLQPKFVPPVAVAPGGGAGMRTQALPRLNEGGNWETTVTYPNAKTVIVTVRTIQPRPDVDLFVDEVGGDEITSDEAVSPNCRVQFEAQAGKSYRFRVENLGPGFAQSTITYTPP